MELDFAIEQEVFEDVKQADYLSTVESENDPEEDPYKSKYAARELLMAAKQKASLCLEGRPLKITMPQSYLYPAFLNYSLAVNYMETGEAYEAEKEINAALTQLDELPRTSHSELLRLAIINQQGCVCCGRANHAAAQQHLEHALTLYGAYKTEFDEVGAAMEEYLKEPVREVNEEVTQARAEALEDQHTFTVFYLAQVYTKLEEGDKAAEYCQKTLQRQLDANKYTAKDWAMNAATLSQYYVTQSNFALSRHCLCASELILSQAHVTSADEEEKELRQDKILKAWADLQRCWGKYCIALLETSKEKLVDELKNPDVEVETKVADNEAHMRPLFALNLGVKEFQITSDWVKDFETARSVFKCGNTWLSKAQEYYQMDGHCTDFIEIVQDISRLYLHLAFFEEVPDRQCRMHKRRVDLLQQVLVQLSHQHYLQYRRTLQFESGEIYSGMMDIKMALVEESREPPTAHALRKINQLARQGIEQYEAFIESFRQPDGQLPHQYEADDQRPVLLAHFYLGRLYSKLVDPDVTSRLQNLQSALKQYRFITEYVERFPAAREAVPQEISVCEDMVRLMHVKMEKIRQSADVYS